MHNEFKSLSPLLRTLWSEARKGGGSMLFCQADDQEALADSILSQLESMGDGEKPQIFHFSFPGYNPKPYAPFLDTCKDQLAGESAGDILRQIDEYDVYYYHAGVLAEYLSSGTVFRRESLVPGELDYESYRMQRSIWNILSGMFTGRPAVFLIENAHYLPRSTLRLLKLVLKSSLKLPFLCVLCAPEIVQNITDAEDSPWSRLLELADQRGLVLNFHQSDRKPLSPGAFQPDRQILDDPQFYDGINAYYLLALDDSARIFQSFIDLQLYHRALPHVKYQVWKYLGLIDLHRNFHETARQHFENALTIAQQIDEEQLLSEAYQLLGSAYLGLGLSGYSLKLAKLAYRNAVDSGDRDRQFQALFLYSQIDNLTHPDDLITERKKLDKAIAMAEELGMENSYTYLISSIYVVSRALNSGSFSEKDYPSVKIARKRDNLQRLGNLYHIIGMAYIGTGNYEKVLQYYRKSKKLKSQLPDLSEQASTNNGIGFYYFYQGEYRKAQNSFAASLDILRNNSQFHEVAMTLYNLALNAFLSRRFEDGVGYADSCLNILKVLQLDTLSFHSRAAIMLLQVLNLLKSGNRLRAWQVKMQAELEDRKVFAQKSEEVFMYCLASALTYQDEGDYPSAYREYCRAEEALVREPNSNYYLYPVFFLEFGDFYLLQSKKDDAQVSFERGLNACREMGNSYYGEILEKRKRYRKLDAPKPYPRISRLDTGWALHGARMKSSLVSLRKRLDDINQLNMLFSIIAEEDNQKDLAENTLDLIYSYFELDFDVIIYLSRRRRDYQQMAIREKTPIPKNEEFSLLIRHLANLNEMVRFTPAGELRDFSGVMESYGGVLSIKVNPKTDPGGLILCFSRLGEANVRPESLQLFSLIGQQFGLAMQKLHQQQTIMIQNQELKQKNDLLKQSSTTDYLTNLGNRASLYDVLDYELSRLQRYNRGGEKQLALLFIDLDNFKFFNDTYGHAAGDTLLIQVSRTIKKVVRHIDTAFRYGGDEFVVILPETDEDGAGELGQRLIREIEECDSYRAVLEEVLGRSIVVPDDKRLSCSIGIAASTRLGDAAADVDSFLNIADKALYQAKLLGKHRIYLA